MSTEMLIETFHEFAKSRNIDRITFTGILNDVFRYMLRKEFGTDEPFKIIVNVDKGDVQAMHVRTVVADDDFENELFEIPLSEARKIDEDYELLEEVAIVRKFDSFGRRVISTVKQILAQKVKDIEQIGMNEYYKERIGEIITGEIHQINKNEILVKHQAETGVWYELVLPRSEWIPKDNFKKGDLVRAVILKVQHQNNQYKVILSRADSLFLRRLLEIEVPEIQDGLVVIRNIVRDPGERAKVTVESYDDRIDPVGACVGTRGSRIQGIVRELRGENIDVIPFSNNVSLMTQRALQPAKATNIVVYEKEKRIVAYFPPDQISLAIGKNGQNIKLASKLLGYEIDVLREGEPDIEDVDLVEFTDEIEEWVIDELKRIGCDTARDVLALSVEELVRRTELEEETILAVIEILKNELGEVEN
ncbi:MAG: transcription termination factor NusA [Bacteroidia bacterium]|nr:transcription termination factor NusA [Bacteroidia bacterium]MDW8302955.1 transcription termination factor NusA [Bacteroidia bacterium]